MERDQRKRKAEKKSAKAKSMKIVEAIKVSISSLVPTSLFHAYLPHATLCVCVCGRKDNNTALKLWYFLTAVDSGRTITQQTMHYHTAAV